MAGPRPKIPLDDPVGRKVTGTSSTGPPRRLRVLTAGDPASPSFPLRCQLHQYSFLPESPRGSPYSLAVCPLRFQAATCVAHSCRFMVGDSSSPTHATRAHPPSRDALHQAVTGQVHGLSDLLAGILPLVSRVVEHSPTVFFSMMAKLRYTVSGGSAGNGQNEGST